MVKYNRRELPIRSKMEMVEDVAKIVRCLHQGQRTAAAPLVEDLKHRALHLEAHVQQSVLMFVEQVEFQYDYDPWHRVTLEVASAADHLIESLKL